MTYLAKALATVVVCVTMFCARPAAAAKALVRSSVKLTANLSAPASKGRVALNYDTNDDDFVAALVAHTTASIVVTDAGGFRVTLNAEACTDSPKKVTCSGDGGMTSIKVVRRPPNAPAPYRVVAKRRNVSATDTGIAALQAPATVTLMRGAMTSRFLRSPSCVSRKPSRLTCKTVFNRNHINSAPSFEPGHSVWLHTPLQAAEKGLYSKTNSPIVRDLGYVGDLSTPDPRVLPGWAGRFSEGPSPTDSGQSLAADLDVVSSSQNLTFDQPPSLDLANGALTFTTTPGTYGRALIQATLRDDGGTAGGGNDTFVTTFGIAVNMPPYVFNLFTTGVMDSPCIPVTLPVGDEDGTWDLLSRRMNSTTNGVLSDAADAPPNGDKVGRALCYRPRGGFTGFDQFSYESIDLEGYLPGFGPAFGTIQVVDRF